MADHTDPKVTSGSSLESTTHSLSCSITSGVTSSIRDPSFSRISVNTGRPTPSTPKSISSGNVTKAPGSNWLD